jgi:hypothetical protein
MDVRALVRKTMEAAKYGEIAPLTTLYRTTAKRRTTTCPPTLARTK